MTTERMRERLASLRPDETAGGWWHATLWIPVGYASTKLYGVATPAVVVASLAGVAALVHRLSPGPVEIVAGGGALVAGVNTAANGDCHHLVGDGGVAVLMVFGGALTASALTRLLGSGNLRDAARHLLIATMALELALSVVTPIGEVVEGFSGTAATAVVLAVLLLAITVTGVRASFGPPALALTLVAVQGVLAVTGGPCHTAAAHALLGTAVFTTLAVQLQTRPLPFGYDPEDDDEGVAWAGDYEDYGPGSGRAREFRVSGDFDERSPATAADDRETRSDAE